MNSEIRDKKNYLPIQGVSIQPIAPQRLTSRAGSNKGKACGSLSKHNDLHTADSPTS